MIPHVRVPLRSEALPVPLKPSVRCVLEPCLLRSMPLASRPRLDLALDARSQSNLNARNEGLHEHGRIDEPGATTRASAETKKLQEEGWEIPALRKTVQFLFAKENAHSPERGANAGSLNTKRGLGLQLPLPFTITVRVAVIECVQSISPSLPFGKGRPVTPEARDHAERDQLPGINSLQREPFAHNPLALTTVASEDCRSAEGGKRNGTCSNEHDARSSGW